MNKETFKISIKNFHDKHYKKLLLIPTLIFIFCFAYMIHFYQVNNDFFLKDVSLTGGTSATIQGSFDSNQVKRDLTGKLEDLETREIYDLITQEKKALIIETKSDAEKTKSVLEDYLGYTLNEENSSFEFSGATLSKSFFRQLMLSLLIAFLLMSLVVFLIFRTFVPSLAVIISAFADIFMTLTFVNILGIKLSSAGIVAFLMLIGYSVDTDILLTNRVLKSKTETINRRIFSAFKTGVTMTLTAIISIGLTLILVAGLSKVLNQILTIIFIGLFFDLINTWITNVSLIKWYAIKKQK
jgi:preprotein translocase subunit SecF